MTSSGRRRAAIAGVTAAVVVVVALVSVVFLLRSRSTAVATALGPVGATETVPCPSSITDGAAFKAAGDEVEGTTFSCGVVVSPENHAKPDGRTIELFYLKLNAKTSPAAPVPLVYLAGGPGSSGSYELSANPLLRQNLDRVRQTRDIIAYDQRGTGYSQYLPCAPFEATLGILQDRDRNPKIAQTIQDLQTQEQGIGYGALRQNLCGVSTTLLAGVDLSQYNSVASAKDIPVLVAALGYTQGFALMGTSYGTTLAQEAMRTVPGDIRGVILDGPSGPSIPNNMWSATKPAAPYEQLLAQCTADRACNAAYPNIAARFEKVLETIAKKPLVLDPPIKVWSALAAFDFPSELKAIDPAFFIALAKVNNIAVGGGFAGQVPRIIQAVEQRDTAWFRASKFDATNSEAVAPPAVATPDAGNQPVFQADQPLFTQPFTQLIAVATAASESAAGQGPDALWVTIALGDLAVRAKKGENQADLMEALLRLTVLPNQGSSAQQLLDYAAKNLSPENAKAADSMVAKMSRNDVRSTMWNIQDVAMTLGTPNDDRHYSYGLQYAVNCANEVDFSSLDQAKADLARTPYPQLAAFPMVLNEQILAGCIAYPSPLDRSVTQPVSSDIPTLIYAGALDNETPAAWAGIVAKNLTKATTVTWKNTGHVAAAHDPKLCAGDVAAAFLTNPADAPDVTCTQASDYQIQFVLK